MINFRRFLELTLITGILLNFLPNQKFFSIEKVHADPATQNAVIFDDSVGNGWNNWSWNSQVSFNNTVSFTPSAWGALYFHNDNQLNLSLYQKLHFIIKCPNDNQKLSLLFYDGNNNMSKELPLNNYGPIQAGLWRSFDIPVSDIFPGFLKGVAFQEKSGQNQPAIYLNNLIFLTSSVSQIASPAPTQSAPPSPVSTSSPAPSAAPLSATPSPSAIPSPSVSVSLNNSGSYTTQNGRVYYNNSEIKIKGINWFGFETDTHAPHGLWARNYKDMISQMKSAGFNAVRLPFCPASVQGTAVSGVDSSKNPDLANLNSLQIMDKILDEFKNQQMYIVLDSHRPDCTAQSDLWYTANYSQDQWLNDLKTLAGRYQSNPYFLGLDLKNEPHGQATWGTGNPATDWNTAAEKAGRAVLDVNPNVLVFVEGVGDNPNCSGNTAHWWGGNLEPVACTPLSESMIPKNKLVLSPHVYGPDVNWQNYFSDSNFPNNMASIWETQYGYLRQKGYTIIPGEWGGKFATNGGSQQDPVLQNALVNYWKGKGICNTFYWDLNPNSGDTGGVLEDDWNTLWPVKINFLQNFYNSCN